MNLICSKQRYNLPKRQSIRETNGQFIRVVIVRHIGRHNYPALCKICKPEMHIRRKPSYKQLEVKTNRTSFLCRHRNEYHNMELNVKTHNRTTQKAKKMSNTDSTKKPG